MRLEPPWRGVGYPIAEGSDTNSILEQAHLDWSIEKYPLFFEIKARSGLERIEVPHSALVRMPGAQFFDLAPNIWNPVQNSDAIESFRVFAESSEMLVHSAGSFDDGKVVWALACKPKGKFFRPLDEPDAAPVVPFVLFSSPHAYGQSVGLRPMMINTQTWTTYLSENYVKLYHAKEFDPKAAQEALFALEHDYDEYAMKANILMKRSLSNTNTIKKYLRKVFPAQGKAAADLSKPATTALEIIDQYGTGNWWKVFDAVLYTMDHVLGNSVNTRLVAAWYGANRRRKIAALEAALEQSK